MLEIYDINVTLMVANLDRAILFYTEILGLKLKSRFGNHWAEIAGPGITIGLHPTREPGASGDNMQIGIRVPDIQNARSILIEKGIVFKTTEDQVRLSHFKDPDDNILYLVQT